MSFTITQKQVEDYIFYGKFEKIKFLKELGYDFTQNNMFIRYAAANGHLEIVKYLKEECGCDPKVDNNQPIINAASNGHLETVRYLKEEYGCDPKVDNNKPIINAAFAWHLEVVKYLIEKCECDPEIARQNTSNKKIIEYLDSLKKEVKQNETNVKEQIKTKLNEVIEILNQN